MKILIILIITGYVLAMHTDMKEMKSEIKEVKHEIENFKTLLTKKVTVTKEYIGTIQQICEKFNYKIPFQSVKAFQTFNADLKENEELREAVVIF